MIRDNFPAVTMLNIPDILRFPIRSWDACAITNSILPSLPHLRAMDVPLTGAIPAINGILKNRIAEVLVVQGDRPKDMVHTTYDTTTISVIERLKKLAPPLRVFAAIDPYRHSIRAERDYIRRKTDAGADGFFTQPFFDVRLLEIYADLLRDQMVFWGVTPVLTEGARSYWEITNNVIFPPEFALTLDANASIARRIISTVESLNGHIYLMPLRIDLDTYLRLILKTAS